MSLQAADYNIDCNTAFRFFRDISIHAPAMHQESAFEAHFRATWIVSTSAAFRKVSSLLLKSELQIAVDSNRRWETELPPNLLSSNPSIDWRLPPNSLADHVGGNHGNN